MRPCFLPDHSRIRHFSNLPHEVLSLRSQSPFFLCIGEKHILRRKRHLVAPPYEAILLRLRHTRTADDMKRCFIDLG